MKIVIITIDSEGTINELISIRPLVSIKRTYKEIDAIIKMPIKGESLKNSCRRAPLPAKIIAALLTRNNPIIISIAFPTNEGLTRKIRSLYDFKLYFMLKFIIILPNII